MKDGANPQPPAWAMEKANALNKVWMDSIVPGSPYSTSRLIDAFASALAEERERCAKIVREHSDVGECDSASLCACIVEFIEHPEA